MKEKKYKKMKGNVRNVSEYSSAENQESMRLNSLNSKTFKKWVMFMSYIVGSTFLTIRFKYFDFIEWFDLNSSPQSLFERLSISDFFS